MEILALLVEVCIVCKSRQLLRPLGLEPDVFYTRVVQKSPDLSHGPHMATFHFYYINEFITTILHGRIDYILHILPSQRFKVLHKCCNRVKDSLARCSCIAQYD